MGLDVIAFPRLQYIGPYVEDYDWHYIVNLRPNEECRVTHDGLAPGLYQYKPGTSFSFRAGSYGGYNEWRSELALLVNTTDKEVWKTNRPGPFVELIDNSDCDAVIGPVTSAKLARDFAEWQARVDALPDNYFRSQYNNWREAFEIASNGGAVQLT